jgi:predicted aconitase
VHARSSIAGLQKLKDGFCAPAVFHVKRLGAATGTRAKAGLFHVKQFTEEMNYKMN